MGKFMRDTRIPPASATRFLAQYQNSHFNSLHHSLLLLKALDFEIYTSEKSKIMKYLAFLQFTTNFKKEASKQKFFLKVKLCYKIIFGMFVAEYHSLYGFNNKNSLSQYPTFWISDIKE